MDHLKASTRSLHRATEKTDFAQRMARGTLRRAEYIAQLDAFHALLVALEGRLDDAEHRVVAEVWDHVEPRSPHIEIDLSWFGARSPGLSPEVLAAIHQIARAPSIALLGWLYVMEGSSLGAQVLQPRIASALHLQREGMRYYEGHGGDTRRRWSEFCRAMNESVPADAAPTICDAATEAFRHIKSIFEALPSRTPSRELQAVPRPSWLH